MVTGLSLYLAREDPPQTSCAAIKIFGKLLNVKRLSLYGGFEPKGSYQALVVCIEQMPSLEELDLHCSWEAGPPLNLILASLRRPSLKKLKLDAVKLGELSDSTTTTSEELDTDPAQREWAMTQLGKMLLNSANNACAVTSLHINKPFFGPVALSLILAWPRALEHFRFDVLNTYASTNKPPAFSLTFFGTVLRLHRASLRTLHLGYIFSVYDLGCLEVADFSSLEMLHVHLESMCGKPAERVASTILAPKLHTVVFDASQTDRQSGTFDLLCQGTCSRFVQFVECAHAQQSALREIKVDFVPSDIGAISDGDYDIDHINECLDMMEDARQRSEQMGVKISYPESLSREHYQAYHERLESGEEIYDREDEVEGIIPWDEGEFDLEEEWSENEDEDEDEGEDEDEEENERDRFNAALTQLARAEGHDPNVEVFVG